MTRHERGTLLNFYATDTEAKLIKEHESGVIIRLLGEQPSELTTEEEKLFTIFADQEKWCRYPSGEYVVYASEERHAYHNDIIIKTIKIPTKTDIKVRIETSLKKLSNIDWWGIPPVIEWDGKSPNPVVWAWNKKYGKPIKTKDGKGYESFPYAYEHFAEIYYADKRFEQMSKIPDEIPNIWRGKLLTIHANPWLEVYNYTKKD